MIRSLRANLTMLANRSYLLGGLGSIAGLAFVSVMLNVSDATTTVDERGPLGDSLTLVQLGSSHGLADALAGTISLIGMVVLAVHATAVASDHSTGMIRNLLVRQPNRLRLLAGKSLALAVATLAAAAVATTVATVTALLFAPSGIDTGAWFTADGLGALARSSGNLALAALAWGMLGQVVAIVSRSAIVSLSIGVSLAIPLDIVVANTSQSAKAWLPGQIFQAIARGGTSSVAYDHALLTTLIAAAIAGAGSLALFHRRDITA